MAIQVDRAWRRLTADGNVRFFKYSWGPGTANALAVRQGAGGWLVVSPPRGAPRGVFDELDGEGGVTALLAPNGYHYLGQHDWRRRFPKAMSWAPRASHERLARRSGGIPFGAAEDLAHELPPGIEIVFPPGQKSPDILLRVGAVGRGEVVWWLGDLFSNTTADDQIWPLRLVSRLAGSGPGYRRNSRPELVYVRDRELWISSVRQLLAAQPPTIVVPAHGDPVVHDAARMTAIVVG